MTTKIVPITLIIAIVSGLLGTLKILSDGGVFQPDIVRGIDTVAVTEYVYVPTGGQAAKALPQEGAPLSPPQFLGECSIRLQLDGPPFNVTHVDIDKDGHGLRSLAKLSVRFKPGIKPIDGYRTCDGRIVTLDAQTGYVDWPSPLAERVNQQ